MVCKLQYDYVKRIQGINNHCTINGGGNPHNINQVTGINNSAH